MSPFGRLRYAVTNSQLPSAPVRVAMISSRVESTSYTG